MYSNSNNDDFDSDLLRAALRFNAIVLGVVFGTLASLIVFIATIVSMAKWGEDAGTYLGLLAVFLPGYTVSLSGALSGAFWAFLFAAMGGYLSYWLYGRLLRDRLAVEGEVSDHPMLEPSILRLDGLSLGLAMGAAIAVSLFVSTAWLVIRGTSHESTHAALLGNYLPGYSPTITGGLLGAFELFLLTLVGCILFAYMYNKIVEFRHK